MTDLHKLAEGIKAYVDEKHETQVKALAEKVEELEATNKALREELEANLANHTTEVDKRLTEAPRPADGRDGLDIEVLSHIDEEKHYPRGTYASHEGGLWKSFQTTDGMKGWECIVEGVKSIDVTQAGREVTIKQVMSSGSEVEKTVSVPAMLYKGVYKQDKGYAQGDVVTHSGSSWIALKETKSIPGSNEWQLMVKKGRDGKSVSLDDVLSKMLPEGDE